MAFLAALIADEILRVGEGFSQDEEMSLVSRQTQHDQILSLDHLQMRGSLCFDLLSFAIVFPNDSQEYGSPYLK